MVKLDDFVSAFIYKPSNMMVANFGKSSSSLTFFIVATDCTESAHGITSPIFLYRQLNDTAMLEYNYSAFSSISCGKDRHANLTACRNYGAEVVTCLAPGHFAVQTLRRAIAGDSRSISVRTRVGKFMPEAGINRFLPW